MKTPHTLKHQPTAPRGFTMIEMLVVIVIIAILMAMVIMGYGTLTEQARRAKANNTASQLVQAWNLYLLQNRMFPDNLNTILNTKTIGGETWYVTDKKFVDALWAKEGNPKKLWLAFDVSQDEVDKAKARWNQDGFCDPWGKYYLFALDSIYIGGNMTGMVPHPDGRTTGEGENIKKGVTGAVIVWSFGPDKEPGKAGRTSENENGETIPDPWPKVEAGEKPADDIIVW